MSTEITLAHLAEANPVPEHGLEIDNSALLLAIRERSVDMSTNTENKATKGIPPSAGPEDPKRPMGWVVALAAFAIVVAVGAAVLLATSNTDTPPATPTTEAPVEETSSVLDLAVEAGQFSTLISAIEAAGLDEMLEGEGPFTVFAPTDAAFEANFEATGIDPDDMIRFGPFATLTAIVSYHIVGEAADSQLVATLDGQSVDTLNGQAINISVVDGQIMVNEATVVSADLIADNGIVHVIDTVLLPPDIAAQLAAGDGTG